MKTLALAAATALVATAAMGAPRALTVREPWSRPAAAGTVGVGYMTLVNRGPHAETLVAAASPSAKRVEVHRSVMRGGVMSMTPERRVTVPAGGSVAFAPGGYHLMFVGLKAALKPGDRLPATLVFADHRRLAVAFVVGTGGPPR
jgi:copper(I)-binding protein